MLVAAAAVLVVLITLLAIPITLHFDVSWRGTLRRSIRVDWAFGLIRVHVPEPRSSDKTRPNQKPPKQHTRRRPRDRKVAANFTDVIAALRLRKFRQRISRFAHSLWSALRKEDVQLDVRIGLGDPAETGQLWAALGPLAAVCTIARDISVKLVPDFSDATFELEGRGRIRLVPGRLLLIAAALLVSPSFWQGIKTLRGVS